MANLFQFLDQDIVLGEVVGDIAASSDIVYTGSPTYFDPIQYMYEHGGIPREDTAYEFKLPELTQDNDPAFAFYVRYAGDKFTVGYTIRDYDAATQTWYPFPVGQGQGMTWFEQYDGCDPDNVQDEDHWKNGLYITMVGPSTMPEGFYSTGTCGYVLGHETFEGHPVERPSVGVYRLDEDQDPPRYVYVSGSKYDEFSYNGLQIAYINKGEGWKLILTKLGHDIESYDDSTAGPGGGYGGDYSFASGFIGFPALPSLSIMDSGIATLWSPSTGEFQGLVNRLWTDDFFNNIIKINADPIENILMAAIVPIDLSSSRGTATEVKVGNWGTGVYMTPLNEQFISRNLGTIKIPEKWKTACDYDATFTLVLPYVGGCQIPASEIVDCKKMEIEYHIDLFSGDFCAYVLVEKDFHYLNAYINNILYSFTGNLMTKLPLTSADYSRIYQQMLNGVSAAVSGVARAAMGDASGIGSAIAGGFDLLTGGNSQPTVIRNGQYTGASAQLASGYAYLLCTYPWQHLDTEYGTFDGYPSYITYQLSDCHGYTKVYKMIENKIPGATTVELDEIERLLTEGVYL